VFVCEPPTFAANSLPNSIARILDEVVLDRVGRHIEQRLRIVSHFVEEVGRLVDRVILGLFGGVQGLVDQGFIARCVVRCVRVAGIIRIRCVIVVALDGIETLVGGGARQRLAPHP